MTQQITRTSSTGGTITEFYDDLGQRLRVVHTQGRAAPDADLDLDSEDTNKPAPGRARKK